MAWTDAKHKGKAIVSNTGNSLKLRNISDLKTYIERSAGDWRNGTLKLGVAGSSGAGKSSFINALRGLTAEEKGSAEVGIKETTTKATPYAHPENKKFLIYDLPGIGTRKFQRGNYLTHEDVGFERYDVFIIITSVRFTDDDLWLADEIEKRGKSFFFVRTKVAEDISNQKKAKPKSFENDPKAAIKIVNEIRQDCMEQMNKPSVKAIFLIDSYAPDHIFLDFDILVLKLRSSIVTMLRDVFMSSILVTNEKLVEEKKEALKQRAVKMSFWSAAGNFIPIPGVSAAADVALIRKEYYFFLGQFGIDKISITGIAKDENKQLQEFAAFLKLEFNNTETKSGNVVAMYLAKYGTTKLVESAAKFFLPVIGSIVSGSMSYTTTLGVMNMMINDMGRDVTKVNAHVSAKVKDSFDTET